MCFFKMSFFTFFFGFFSISFFHVSQKKQKQNIIHTLFAASLANAAAQLYTRQKTRPRYAL